MTGKQNKQWAGKLHQVIGELQSKIDNFINIYSLELYSLVISYLHTYVNNKLQVCILEYLFLKG